MYVLMKKGRLALVVLLYVDDVLYTGDSDEIAKFEKEIARRFDLKSTTQATSYLGIDIAQNHRRGEVILSQPTYIKEAIERFKLQDAKRVRTPLATLANKPELTAPLLTDRRLYQAMVGVLLYINLTTRPDISYAVHFLTRYTAAPTQYHLSCAKRVLIYLRDTAHHGLIYRRDTNKDIQCYVDSSFADAENRRSTYGYIISLGGNILQYKTRQQRSVATSTTEAEYTAVAHAVRELMYLRNLTSETDIALKDLPTVFVDNQSTLKVLTNNSSTSRIKHIDIALQYLKERRDLKYKYVISDENIADIFTKPLGFNKYSKFRNAILTDAQEQE